MKLNKLSKGGRIALAIGAAGAASGIGLLAVPATFGGFTSSASNNGNSVAAGTLQMTDSANGAVVTVSNLDPNCANDNVATTAPCEGHGTVTIKNTGSLPATMQLTLGNVVDTPQHSTLSSPGITTGGGAITTLNVASLPAPIANGDTITVGTGGTTDTFTAAAAAATGDTSITISSATPANDESTGARVVDTTSWGTSALSGMAVVSIKDTTTGTVYVGTGGNVNSTSNVNPNLVTLTSAASGSPYTINGTAGVGKQWQPNESHSFAVSVQLPLGAGNGYQGTSSTFDLTWNGAP